MRGRLGNAIYQYTQEEDGDMHMSAPEWSPSPSSQTTLELEGPESSNGFRSFGCMQQKETSIN